MSAGPCFIEPKCQHHVAQNRTIHCYIANPKDRPRVGTIITLNKCFKKQKTKTFFLSYLNSPRRGCPRVCRLFDDLLDGRQPQFFSKWKTTSFFS